MNPYKPFCLQISVLKTALHLLSTKLQKCHIKPCLSISCVIGKLEIKKLVSKKQRIDIPKHEKDIIKRVMKEENTLKKKKK